MADQPSAPEVLKTDVAVKKVLADMTREEILAWRVAPVDDRPSADERGLPDEFPFGWFAVHYSDELAVGEVRSIRYFGQELALWRGEDGVARVIDAYCAHYGANMGHGGKVHGNLLECPFHAWRYDEQGAVQEIPYAKNIPPQARKKDCVPSWPTKEANGFIYVWYHPNRVEPLWDLEVIPEVGDPDWTPFKKYEWRVYTSLENMADNGVDISHFKFVHGAPFVPDYEMGFEGIRRSVLAKINFVTPKGNVKGAIDSITHGPGQGWVRFTGIAETLLVSAVTPVDRDVLRVRFAFTQPKAQADGPMAGVSKALIRDICTQLDQDKVILDYHKRMAPPLVCDGDGPFGRNRIYYSQFFASTNPTGKIAA
jgi:nitrite reductase/ring-hydroxylating ferredoxin subunit